MTDQPLRNRVDIEIEIETAVLVDDEGQPRPALARQVRKQREDDGGYEPVGLGVRFRVPREVTGGVSNAVAHRWALAALRVAVLELEQRCIELERRTGDGP